MFYHFAVFSPVIMDKQAHLNVTEGGVFLFFINTRGHSQRCGCFSVLGRKHFSNQMIKRSGQCKYISKSPYQLINPRLSPGHRYINMHKWYVRDFVVQDVYS